MPPVQTFISNHIESSGYLAVLVLGIIAAMCIPIPSEIIFGFAGAWCSSSFVAPVNGTEHHGRFYAVLLVGIAATVIGSCIAYLVGRLGGRAFVDRYGKYVLLSHEDLDRSEAMFSRFGDGMVAVGQIVPFVRAFIGFGAGVARVPTVRFVALTTLGAAVWVCAITTIGYEAASSIHTVEKWFGDAGYVIAAIVVVVIVAAVAHRWRSYHSAQSRERVAN